jgi:hypothetical protein
MGKGRAGFGFDWTIAVTGGSAHWPVNERNGDFSPVDGHKYVSQANKKSAERCEQRKFLPHYFVNVTFIVYRRASITIIVPLGA